LVVEEVEDIIQEFLQELMQVEVAEVELEDIENLLELLQDVIQFPH
jgi:hypothetical protein